LLGYVRAMSDAPSPPSVSAAAPVQSGSDLTYWTYFQGEWAEGERAIISGRAHGLWLGSSVFDGARYFDGVVPDLDQHCARLNRSALALGLTPVLRSEEIAGLAVEGLRRFAGEIPIYVHPGYFADHGLPAWVTPDPASTRFCLSLIEAPFPDVCDYSLTVSPFRRATIEAMPTNAKAGCLYPNSARALQEAADRGFNGALMLDMLGNVAETATSNIFIVKKGVVRTPAPNGSFLAGITRMRIIWLLNAAGVPVEEASLALADLLDADEIFTTGNFAKVVPVTRFEDRALAIGKRTSLTRQLYFDWARSLPRI
jgi:branched-chain amino acid aminotransferase